MPRANITGQEVQQTREKWSKHTDGGRVIPKVSYPKAWLSGGRIPRAGKAGRATGGGAALSRWQNPTGRKAGRKRKERPVQPGYQGTQPKAKGEGEEG